jgi:hypothetical protein
LAGALAELKIEHIASYSPEGRGRMERMFGTLQQRLPPLLRLNGITTMAAANRYLAQTCLPEHNARFAVAAAEAGSAFVPFVGALDDILCIKEERVVSRDNCVRYNNRILQITEQVHRHHYVKATVHVHEYPDGGLAVFHGPRCLARYRPTGELASLSKPQRERSADLAPAQRCARHRQDHTACGGGPPAGRASLDRGCAPRSVGARSAPRNGPFGLTKE